MPLRTPPFTSVYLTLPPLARPTGSRPLKRLVPGKLMRAAGLIGGRKWPLFKKSGAKTFFKLGLGRWRRRRLGVAIAAAALGAGQLRQGIERGTGIGVLIEAAPSLRTDAPPLLD